MKLRNLTAATLLVLVASSCGEEPPPPAPKPLAFTLEVDVSDSQSNPLPKVAVSVDEKVVGYTDAEGKFTAVLKELAGESITLGVVAPTGYRFAPDTDTVTEVLKTASVNGQVSGVPVFLSATAESLEKDYFIWVKAACDNGCEGWPVMLNGEEVDKTNAMGFSHFSFTDQPNNEIELQIMTPKPYKPENPKYSIELELDSTVYRLEQAFTDPSKRVVRVATKGGGKKGSKGSKGGKTEKKEGAAIPAPDEFVPLKPKKEEGVIDLFGN